MEFDSATLSSEMAGFKQRLENSKDKKWQENWFRSKILFMKFNVCEIERERERANSAAEDEA